MDRVTWQVAVIAIADTSDDGIGGTGTCCLCLIKGTLLRNRGDHVMVPRSGQDTHDQQAADLVVPSGRVL